MVPRPRLALASAALLAASGTPLLAQQPLAATPAPSLVPASLPEELVLRGDNLVTALVNGEVLRLEVSAEAFGPPIINPDTAARLMLVPTAQRGWRFGPVVVVGNSATAPVDLGAGAVPLTLSWTDRPVSRAADGIIGVHHLPYRRVTFAYREPAGTEQVERFALRRTGGSGDTRIGTEVRVGKKRMMMIFVPERRENLITAPTANFIATHREGGFEQGSAGLAVMSFGVERPTRTMRIAMPIALGSLALERFAVRVEDYGEPTRVGEIAANDPRFDPNHILVSRRKGRGRPDLLTRIGSEQIAHCSSLTYDFAAGEIRLSCTPGAQD